MLSFVALGKGRRDRPVLFRLEVGDDAMERPAAKSRPASNRA
jgi:hypothetical protein